MTPTSAADLVIIANRLPVDRVQLPDGTDGWRRSPGGLVTALEPVMRANDGAWIGWPGSADYDLDPFVEDGLQLVPVREEQQRVVQTRGRHGTFVQKVVPAPATGPELDAAAASFVARAREVAEYRVDVGCCAADRINVLDPEHCGVTLDNLSA